jgi:cell division septation protein DedD
MAPASAPPAARPAPKEEKYVVLAATYGQLAQAQALARRLQARKLAPRIAKTKTGNKTTYQVRLGPMASKKQAEEVARTLKTKEHLSPQITRVKPPAGRTAADQPAAGRTVNNRRTPR